MPRYRIRFVSIDGARWGSAEQIIEARSAEDAVAHARAAGLPDKLVELGRAGVTVCVRAEAVDGSEEPVLREVPAAG